MKMILKWTACAACAVWAGASASAATETVTGQNVIGLTTINPTFHVRTRFQLSPKE